MLLSWADVFHQIWCHYDTSVGALFEFWASHATSFFAFKAIDPYIPIPGLKCVCACACVCSIWITLGPSWQYMKVERSSRHRKVSYRQKWNISPLLYTPQSNENNTLATKMVSVSFVCVCVLWVKSPFKNIYWQLQRRGMVQMRV